MRRRLSAGMLYLRVTGAEPWRFLNRCAEMGIVSRDVRSENQLSILLRIRPEELAAAREAARRCGCTCEIVSRSPLLSAARRLRRRIILAAGAAVLAMGLYTASLFVWDIRVTENDSQLSSAQILRTLESQGVGVGSFWPSFRGERIRSNALSALPELSWLAVNVRGGIASVQVRRAVSAPEIWDVKRSGDVVARCGGVIRSVRILAGESRANPGDAVTAGQVLAAGTASEPHARGEVEAYTYYEWTASAPVRYWEKTPSGAIRRRYALVLGRNRINFYADSGFSPANCDKIIQIWQLAAENAFSLPLRLVRETYIPYTLRETPEDPEALRTALETLLRERLSQELEGRGEILRTNFTACVGEELLTVTLRAECLERIDRDAAAAP